MHLFKRFKKLNKIKKLCLFTFDFLEVLQVVLQQQILNIFLKLKCLFHNDKLLKYKLFVLKNERMKEKPNLFPSCNFSRFKSFNCKSPLRQKSWKNWVFKAGVFGKELDKEVLDNSTEEDLWGEEIWDSKFAGAGEGEGEGDVWKFHVENKKSLILGLEGTEETVEGLELLISKLFDGLFELEEKGFKALFDELKLVFKLGE